ncbi:uncharacterized protein B0I36DRAFT_37984 [Microdochium trichocladiopsis]|uniref:Uncharacterized protein n=1 Tax=Microdochium trichocladiopsis TaxID=1682393 RepID=A0A9P8XU07_9PEZI|nr:uncharacterized protein B0I36DRAFT_37984 [Microdochium trichocladiopsis]KAH7018335.1 hypothetical protein B0I36DRAFT_37984 [Microdochium trichocladiopsis]
MPRASCPETFVVCAQCLRARMHFLGLGCLGAGPEFNVPCFCMVIFFSGLPRSPSPPPAHSTLRHVYTHVTSSAHRPLSIALLLWVTSVCQIPLLLLLCTSTSRPIHPIILAPVVFVSRPCSSHHPSACVPACHLTSYSIFAPSDFNARPSWWLD